MRCAARSLQRPSQLTSKQRFQPFRNSLEFHNQLCGFGGDLDARRVVPSSRLQRRVGRVAPRDTCTLSVLFVDLIGSIRRADQVRQDDSVVRFDKFQKLAITASDFAHRTFR